MHNVAHEVFAIRFAGGETSYSTRIFTVAYASSPTDAGKFDGL